MKTKLLYIHSNTSVGGATNSLLYNVLNLSKDKFSVKVLFLGKKGPASELFLANGVEIDHLEGITNYQHAENAIIKWGGRNPIKPITRFFRMLQSVSKIEAYLREADCDMIHINTSVMLPVGLAAKRVGVKTVWHVREPIAKGTFGIRKTIVRKIINSCSDKIIAISKQDAIALGSGNKSKIEIVYNFVNFNSFNKEIYRFSLHDELGISLDTKIITTLGGVIHSKGTDIFIKAAAKILKQHPDSLFIVVGYPPTVSQRRRTLFGGTTPSYKCLQLINELKLEENVKFIGIRNDIPQVLASSSILMWPASIPHFSRPIIEAQAMGVPAIGTDFAITREVIEPEKTGLLFKRFDDDDLAAKANMLLEDENLYNSILEEGYKQAIVKFNSANNFKTILGVYNDLLGLE